MLYLVLSIFCSVSVGVIFKMTRKYQSNPMQIIALNYIVAIILCYLIFNPDINDINRQSNWSLYISIGILLPLVFHFLVQSVKHIGIVKTDAAQRLSLFIPIIAAWVIFNENFNTYKIIGLLVGFASLVLILNKPSKEPQGNWLFPTVVLLGFGVIDVLFKQMALHTTVPYTTSLVVIFEIALVISICIVVFEVIIKKAAIGYKNLLFGILVGIFNFGNILFYLKAHKVFAENPSTVFVGMNMGVIVLGTAVGVFFFKEKLSNANVAGLFLALIAIFFIVLSQILPL